jgi:lipopolysaccharide export system protein LptC
MDGGVEVQARDRAAAGGRPAGPSPPAAPSRRAVLRRQPPRFSGRNRYSLFVGWMKLLLPALAAALVLLVVAWPQLLPMGRHGVSGLAKLGLDQADSLTMIKPHFEGMDKNDRPFTITADRASQASGDSEMIALEAPQADMTLEDGAWLALTAETGSYARERRLLELEGRVNLFHDKGFELATERALIDLAAGVARGDRPVSGQGPLGMVDAEGFEVHDRGRRILFTGESRLVLYPQGEAGQ